MPTDESVEVPLAGLALPDSAGVVVDLGALDGTWLLTAIRHRF